MSMACSIEARVPLLDRDIVELGEDLQSELDLESLSRISEQAMKYLEDLDPLKLSPETSIRVGQRLIDNVAVIRRDPGGPVWGTVDRFADAGIDSFAARADNIGVATSNI